MFKLTRIQRQVKQVFRNSAVAKTNTTTSTILHNYGSDVKDNLPEEGKFIAYLDERDGKGFIKNS